MMSLRTKFNNVFRRANPSSSPSKGKTPRRHSEAGETLVEVLLALIILAMASVALITAFGTDISASAEHRSLANFDTALASSIATTTSLIQGQYASVFATCPTPQGSLSGYPSSAVLSSALNITGYTASIEASGTLPAVEYTDGSSFSGTCTPNTPTAPGNVSDPQLITLVLTDTATGYSQTNSVVVVDPTVAPVSPGNSKAAAQLEFVTQPEGATVGTNFTTQPILEVLDGNGKIVTTDLSPITLTLNSTNGAALSSTCSGVETSGVVVYSGCSINEVGTAYSLTASEPSPSTPGQQLISTSTSFGVYSAQLATPMITAVAPSQVTAGAINVTFKGSTPAPPGGQSYTIKACTNFAMSSNCTTPTSFTSGSDLTGLTPGARYYVQVTAVASPGYAASTSPPPNTPTMATVQLTAPGTPALNYGPSAGSLAVSFSPSSPPVAPSQTYTVEACTNNSMSTGCVSNTNFTSGGNLTGLTYIPGSLTSSYYVWVSANASSGYLAYTPTGKATAFHAVTSQVQTPTGLTAASSASQVGAITATFSEASPPPGGTAPSSYTAMACTDPGMSVGCVTVNGYTSGAQLGGLTPGNGYYVEITANTSATGYLSATTAATASPAVATAQLVAPTGVNLAYGPDAGSLTVSFTPPTVAAANQSYTVKACTNAGMSANCLTKTNFTSGDELAGLNYNVGGVGVTYWVQVTANGSSGYLVSPATTPVSQADESQLAAPTGVTLGYGPDAGSLTISFTPPTVVAPNQTYTAEACSNFGMSNGCTSNANFTSGGELADPNYNVGSAVGTYWVEVTANGSSAYVASSATTPVSHTFEGQVGPPGTPTATTSTTGAIVVRFTAPSGVAPSYYNATACTDNAMTLGCVSINHYTSNTKFTGLVSGTSYYVQITAVGPAGYLSSNSAVSINTTKAG